MTRTKFLQRLQSTAIGKDVLHRFVLTPDERCVLIFVVGACLLGLGTMYYRAVNPPAPRISTENLASSHQDPGTADKSKTGTKARKRTPAKSLEAPGKARQTAPKAN